MKTAGKVFFLFAALLLHAVALIVLWDGDAERLRTAWAVLTREGGAGRLLEFERPRMTERREIGAPLEFFDLVERDYPVAFARNFDAATTAGLPAAYETARSLGQKVYVREGCFHCHSQYVRAGTADERRWGSPTEFGTEDIRTAGFPLAGSRRVGPDLARESNRRTNDWHAAHLYRPQSILPGSIMPGYPWLFEEVGGRIEPNQEGLGLIIYVQSLGAEADEAHY